MKILQLITSFSFAGAEQVILDICSLQEHQFEVAALQPGDLSFKKRAQDKNLVCHDLHMKNKLDFTVITRLKQLIQDEKYDLVHTHLVHANFIGRLAAHACGVPVISTIHIIEKRWRPMHTLMERFTASKACRITCVSEAVRQHTFNSLRLPADKLITLANGIDTERFKPGQARDIDFLFLGRLDRQKGLDRLLPHLDGLPLTIVGQGPDAAALKQQSQKLGCQTRFEGVTDCPETWFARTRVVVIPSRYEGFGLVAAEALACGCQVVHSGVDSLPEVVGPHGILLPHDTSQWSDTLKNALKTFSEDSNRRQWVLEHFDKHTMATRYEEIYRACAASPD